MSNREPRGGGIDEAEIRDGIRADRRKIIEALRAVQAHVECDDIASYHRAVMVICDKLESERVPVR